MKTCPICKEGGITEHLDVEDYWDEHFFSWKLPSKWSDCDTCGSEFATAAQVRFNKEEMDKIKRINEKWEKGL